MNRARALSSLLLATALATATTGCKGALGQVAAGAAVAAITAVQIAAMKPRQEANARNVAAASAPPPLTPTTSPCGRCPEPDNGYAICFVSTCEVRCIEGYVLDRDVCVPVGGAETN